jgi:hypothetical protein
MGEQAVKKSCVHVEPDGWSSDPQEATSDSCLRLFQWPHSDYSQIVGARKEGWRTVTNTLL